MHRILFVILAVLIVATVGVYAIFSRDLAAARARLVGPQHDDGDVLWRVGIRRDG